MSKHIKSITRMMRRVLNTLDYHLMDHGDRVAYLVLQMYKSDSDVNTEELSKICYLSMFHDIGAYQTESLNSLTDHTDHFSFELKNTLAHSVYSHIFFSEYKFFQGFCEGLLFHHFPYQKLIKSDCNNKKFASRLFLADKIDMLIIRKPNISADEIIKHLNNPTICPSCLELMTKLEDTENVLTKAIQGSYHEELMLYLDKLEKEVDLESFIYVVPHAIDFRSEHTVTHTVATVEISTILGKLFNFSEFELEEIYYGSLLHDIGKVSISTMVLEKDSSLSDIEFGYMKEHVTLSEHILTGCVSDNVFKIAVRHHEKADGLGYPNGLKLEDLSTAERIVAVADIMSALLGKRSYKDPFPPERVMAILKNLKEKNQLCGDAIDVALENYNLIDEKVKIISDIAMKRFAEIKQIEKELTKRCENFLM